MIIFGLPLEVLLYIASAVLLIFGMTCWIIIAGEYTKGRKSLSSRAVSFIWVTDTLFFAIVACSSIFSVWRLNLSNNLYLLVGLLLFVFGLLLMIAAMIQFRSFRKISGSDNSSGIVIDGIYAFGRNPQYVGWFLWFIGISLMGRSAFALVITIAFMIGMHFYTVLVEEPHLTNVFGEKYKTYLRNTPRYFGVRKPSGFTG